MHMTYSTRKCIFRPLKLLFPQSRYCLSLKDVPLWYFPVLQSRYKRECERRNKRYGKLARNPLYRLAGLCGMIWHDIDRWKFVLLYTILCSFFPTYFLNLPHSISTLFHYIMDPLTCQSNPLYRLAGLCGMIWHDIDRWKFKWKWGDIHVRKRFVSHVPSTNSGTDRTHSNTITFSYTQFYVLFSPHISWICLTVYRSAMLSRVLICCVELCWVMLDILSYV